MMIYDVAIPEVEAFAALDHVMHHDAKICFYCCVQDLEFEALT